MKSLNSTAKLWTSLSAEDVDTSDYQAACCLNARINAPADRVRNPEIVIDTQTVSVDFLKKVLERAERGQLQPGKFEDIQEKK